MRVRLQREGWSGYRPWQARAGHVAGVLAWTTWEGPDSAVVHVRRGADYLVCGLARVGHELWHVLSNLGNDAHHAWTTPSLASFSPIRFFRWPASLPGGLDALHLEAVARDLRRIGAVDLPPGGAHA